MKTKLSHHPSTVINPRGLGGLTIGRYAITLQFEEPAVLPRFPGATLRGAFGMALKRTVCVNRRRICSQCMLRSTCLYLRIFDTTAEDEYAAARGRTTPPRPFVIDPPLITKRAFEPGEHVIFLLTLFGNAAEHLPHFVFAFSRLEMMGLGRARARFALQSVQELLPHDPPRELFQRASQSLAHAAPPPPASAWVNFSAPTRRRALSLAFLTPVRVKSHHRYQTNMPFDILWNALRRRIDDLYAAYSPATLEIDWTPMYHAAQQMRVTTSSLRWIEFERFSRRQQTAMTLGGLVGDVAYQGPLRLFLPWLQLGELIHIGKNTTFGFGKYSINN